MKPSFHSSRKIRGGFTLVEILVSFTVLGLIMVGVAQMMNSALSATIGSYKHMDADTQARMVLDRMAFDISKITKRSDVDYFFKKNTTAGTTPGNDQMAFYTEAGGYYPNDATTAQDGEVSLVGYMINSNNQLVRLSKGLVWNGANNTDTAVVFNPLANVQTNPLTTIITSNTITSTWPQVSTGLDPNYQVIGDQVFRFEYSFLVQASPNSSGTNTGEGLFDAPWSTAPEKTPNGLQNVTAIIVSIAVLDNNSRAIVNNISSTALQTAASKLADDGFPSTSGASAPSPGSMANKLPLPLWKATLGTALGNGTNLGLPKSVASQVRFYQRYCYLNHLQ
jgi:Tfp pilus assembly protein PilV